MKFILILVKETIYVIFLKIWKRDNGKPTDSSDYVVCSAGPKCFALKLCNPQKVRSIIWQIGDKIKYEINKKASSRLLTIYNKHLLRYFSEGEVVYVDTFIRCRVPEISIDDLSNDYWLYSDKPADYCNMRSKLLIGKIQNLKGIIFSDIKRYFPHPKVLQRHYSSCYAPEKPHHMKFLNARDRLLRVLNWLHFAVLCLTQSHPHAHQQPLWSTSATLRTLIAINSLAR